MRKEGIGRESATAETSDATVTERAATANSGSAAAKSARAAVQAPMKKPRNSLASSRVLPAPSMAVFSCTIGISAASVMFLVNVIGSALTAFSVVTENAAVIKASGRKNGITEREGGLARRSCP